MKSSYNEGAKEIGMGEGAINRVGFGGVGLFLCIYLSDLELEWWDNTRKRKSLLGFLEELGFGRVRFDLEKLFMELAEEAVAMGFVWNIA
jgi:hypothetical protein